MKRLAILFAFALFLLLPTTVAAADCQFVLGFKTLRDLIGHDIVGECGENERYNSIGDSVQQTTGGLLVWRKADNWTAFTDGHRTWINGPNGLVRRHINERFKWELDYAPGGLSVVNCRSQAVVTETVLNLGASPPPATQADGPAPSLIALARGAGWYRDGVAYGIRSPEGEVLTVLEKIDRDSPHIARAAANWQWLFDEDMQRDEWHVIEYIARLEDYVPVYVPRLLALPWVHDGVDRVEAEMVSLLYREALCYGLDFAVELATAPWLLDGIDEDEVRALGTVRNHAERAYRMIPALLRKSWLRDGITENELAALTNLLSLAVSASRQEEEAALAVLEMPFLNDSIDQIDIFTLQSLTALHRATGGSNLQRVLSHPDLRDGITAADRGFLATLGLVSIANPDAPRTELLDVLLDPTRTRVEERVIHLPRAGQTTLTVVHTRPGAFHTMDILERSVRAQEDFMLEAFPTKLVALLVADVNDNGGGALNGRLFVDPGREEHAATIGHEAGHTYWSLGPPWLREGGAIVLELAAQGHLGAETSWVFGPFIEQCHLADNLSELERIEKELRRSGVVRGPGHISGVCPYDLGWALFRDLINGLGDRHFREGFHRLYVKMRDDAHSDECSGDESSVCYMKFAFVTDAAPEAAAVALPIINRWYYGSEHGPP